MNNKMIFAVVVVLGVLALGMYSYISPSPASMSDEDTQALDSVSKSDSDKTAPFPMNADTSTAQKQGKIAPSKEDIGNYQYVQDRLDLMQMRRPGANYDPAEVAAALARTDAWKPSPTAPTGLPLSQEELTDGRQFIEFDSLKIETLEPGDSVKLTIDDTGQQYNVNIDNVEQQDESRITWTGHIDGHDGQPYHVSFTKGETLTVGGIDTPDGHYVVQAHGNKGWVASSGLLFKEHVDPIVPPEEELGDQPADTSGDPHAGHTD
jgi:hypothetical protein